MNWYFCLDQHGSGREIGAWADIAVQSARKNTSLTPICLFDGSADCEFVNRMRALDVEVRFVRSRIADAIEDAHRRIQYPLHGKGAFLRAEIPDQESGREYAFYTDCDVVFANDPKFDTLKPKVLSAGPRQNLYDTGQFNSGVLYFNVEGFRAVQDGFFDFASRNLGPFLPGMDEPMFNRFFADTFDILPVGLNWRPFFGFNKSASIVHFHGPKMLQLVQFVTAGPSIEWGFYSNTLSKLMGSSIGNYARYLEWVATDFDPPPAIGHQLDRFFKAYPSFQSQLAERYGEAVLEGQRQSKMRTDAIVRKNALIGRMTASLPAGAFKSVKYRFSGKAVVFPNLLVSLFETSGFGVLESITYQLIGEADEQRCDLSSLSMKEGSSIANGNGFWLLGDHGAAQVLIGPSSIAERSRVSSITLHCLEYTPESKVSAIFADSKAGFYPMNTVIAERITS